ncbi:MAG TPA: CRTAC1 family protein [Streptosporangiaceae bacterium]|nr:CRTAC1 family protein [Streptosporangiaceae bacterium]
MAAIALITGLFFVARPPATSAAVVSQVARSYKFRELPVAMPPGYRPAQTIRRVNPAYYHLRSWISSVGAGIALADVTGHGRDDGMCIVDPRTDDVIVTYAPAAPAADRFTPFTLRPGPLPYDSAMAPMGCVPGDFNGDGRTDFLVYYWGRTPIAFLARSTATRPSPVAYRPVELMPEATGTGQYNGPDWNTNAVAVADFDGTGHPDLFVGNYFPDSAVLDPHGIDNVAMPSSLSNAKNGGGDYVFRWLGGTSGPNPTVRYQMVPNAVPYDLSTGWTLGAATADLTGNGLPDLYIANDFGPGHLLYNRSVPGHIRFSLAIGHRGWTTPKSFVLGRGSFKGMGADFGDLADNGRFDLMVSNITTAWGLEESNFVFMNDAASDAQMKSDLASGFAPFSQQAEQMGMAWTGWAWDVKSGDFLNSGQLDVVQTDGFVKGRINRWPWLQEMAMNNDDLASNPADWPLVQPGDDIAGHQCIAFYAPGPGMVYVNISKQLGLCVPAPTRGVATADTRADGHLDFAVARQWGPPAFYANESPRVGSYLGLELYRPAVGGGTPGQGLAGPGSPAYGTTVQVSTPGHAQISQLDGGSGSAGKRSFEVYFGLGSYHGPVTVLLHWRDSDGQFHQQVLRLAPGTHTLMLTSTAKEVPSR